MQYKKCEWRCVCRKGFYAIRICLKFLTGIKVSKRLRCFRRVLLVVGCVELLKMPACIKVTLKVLYAWLIHYKYAGDKHSSVGCDRSLHLGYSVKKKNEVFAPFYSILSSVAMAMLLCHHQIVIWKSSFADKGGNHTCSSHTPRIYVLDVYAINIKFGHVISII